MTFAQWLQGHLNENKLTAAALSRALQVSRVCVSQWLSEDRFPDRDSQKKIVKYFSKEDEETKKNLIVDLFYLERTKPTKKGN